MITREKESLLEEANWNIESLCELVLEAREQVKIAQDEGANLERRLDKANEVISDLEEETNSLKSQIGNLESKL
jgi:phage shock protein A